MSEYTMLGKRVPRVDALDKATGRAQYSADISLPNNALRQGTAESLCTRRNSAFGHIPGSSLKRGEGSGHSCRYSQK